MASTLENSVRLLYSLLQAKSVQYFYSGTSTCSTFTRNEFLIVQIHPITSMLRSTARLGHMMSECVDDGEESSKRERKSRKRLSR
jgi:hypothetical protein